LSGRLQGLHSVSINLSYRITLELLIKGEEIIPVNVGDHRGNRHAEMLRLAPISF
jgi:proteic killer suppression protein